MDKRLRPRRGHRRQAAPRRHRQGALRFDARSPASPTMPMPTTCPRCAAERASAGSLPAPFARPEGQWAARILAGVAAVAMGAAQPSEGAASADAATRPPIPSPGSRRSRGARADLGAPRTARTSASFQADPRYRQSTTGPRNPPGARPHPASPSAPTGSTISGRTPTMSAASSGRTTWRATGPTSRNRRRCSTSTLAAQQVLGLSGHALAYAPFSSSPTDATPTWQVRPAEAASSTAPQQQIVSCSRPTRSSSATGARHDDRLGLSVRVKRCARPALEAVEVYRGPEDVLVRPSCCATATAASTASALCRHRFLPTEYVLTAATSRCRPRRLGRGMSTGGIFNSTSNDPPPPLRRFVLLDLAEAATATAADSGLAPGGQTLSGLPPPGNAPHHPRQCPGAFLRYVDRPWGEIGAEATIERPPAGEGCSASPFSPTRSGWPR